MKTDFTPVLFERKVIVNLKTLMKLYQNTNLPLIFQFVILSLIVFFRAV